MKAVIVKSKIKSTSIPFSDLIVGKLYNYSCKYATNFSGVVLLVNDNSAGEPRLIELKGGDSGAMWGARSEYDKYIFTDFTDILKLSND